MRFKIDENLPLEMSSVLREEGHDAQHVIEEGLSGRCDAEIASVCLSEKRTLITLDLDFGDIRTYPPEHHRGIVLFRLSSNDRGATIAAVRRVLPLLVTHGVDRTLWVVEDERIRVRGSAAE